MHSYPDFLIVGMMKAGTTSIFKHLSDHPRVVRPIEKELHFFTRDLHTRIPPAAWGLEYGEQLGLCGCEPRDGKLTGEASPSYIAVPERIHAFNPNCKIIIVLRDPVSRAVSQLRHYNKYSYRVAIDGFTAQYDTDKLHKLDAVIDSTYLPRLKRWLTIFSHEQIALVCFEAFIKEPQLVMNDLYQWLGLDEQIINKDFRGAKTEIHYDETTIRSRLEDYFASLRGQVVAEILAKNIFLVPNDLSLFSRY